VFTHLTGWHWKLRPNTEGQEPRYAIQLANDDVWDSLRGHNVLGFIPLFPPALTSATDGPTSPSTLDNTVAVGADNLNPNPNPTPNPNSTVSQDHIAILDTTVGLNASTTGTSAGTNAGVGAGADTTPFPFIDKLSLPSDGQNIGIIIGTTLPALLLALAGAVALAIRHDRENREKEEEEAEDSDHPGGSVEGGCLSGCLCCCSADGGGAGRRLSPQEADNVMVRCVFSDRIWHSMMPLDPTHSSRASTALIVAIINHVETLKASAIRGPSSINSPMGSAYASSHNRTHTTYFDSHPSPGRSGSTRSMMLPY